MPEIQDKFDRLRQQAEELLSDRPAPACEESLDFFELMHELKVHQAELEIQNEELKRAQDELTALQQEYQNLYEFAPCGYITVNPRGTITRANLTAVTLLDIPRSLLLRSGFSQFLDQGYAEAYFSAKERAEHFLKKQSLELPLKKRSGTPLWVRVDIEAEQDKNSDLAQFRVVLLDISEQRRAEEEKRMLEDQLRQSQKMETVGTLAGGIAHEFNNIMNIVMLSNGLILDQLEPGSPLLEFADEIQNASLRARDVVKKLLTFSRSGGSEQKLMDLAAIIAESLNLMKTITPKNIDIRDTLASVVSPVFGDATQMHQLIINLCANARDAVSDDGGRIDIELHDENTVCGFVGFPRTLQPGRYVKLMVRDNGCGMDRTTMKKIFDPYFTTKEMGKGTGIGLSIVHGIVDKHGGSINVSSQPGKGSLFTVLFPVYEGTVETETEAPRTSPTGNERILFIDDETAIVRLAKVRLERLGYTVKAFTEPLDALDAFRADPDAFDLVITDMAMPVMTGDRLAAEFLSLRPDIPIILCTGFSDQMSDEKAREMGICAFAMKPFDKNTFAVTVRNALDGVKGKDE